MDNPAPSLQALPVDPGTTVYVACPAFFKTGGTELLHQLVHTLNRLGRRACIVYQGATEDQNIHPAFSGYVSSYCTVEEVPDEPRHILVVPEVYTALLRRFRQIRKAVWWESVDNYLFHTSIRYNLREGNLRPVLWVLRNRFRSPQRSLSLKELRQVPHHFVQSQYARDFLEKHGIRQSAWLSDYINDVYLRPGSPSARQDLVCYNPKKGYAFTRRLIRHCRDVTFVPLVNMDNAQILRLLGQAKLYIDFGNHPGKDRFPREAASQGCCVITGLRGSAGFQEDIPIPSRYKFSQTRRDLPRIHRQIRHILSSYDTCIEDFRDYQRRIAAEPEAFVQDVSRIFPLT